MKIHDFGLWFLSGQDYEYWSTTIPQSTARYEFYYDGVYMGCQSSNFDLAVEDDQPHIIRLKCEFLWPDTYIYVLDRVLTLDDFEIVINPNYEGPK